eukprot:TRINITY_DN61027_c0_g1_i1.p1 TRINITY_DN61027_c0_g1~~TRINITY_DN61027_c0_g1_i1.p1  ORF type:complete len:513 (+),score=57.15 TRINITY_DN61027_c0_g1_i1:56-1594(+)
MREAVGMRHLIGASLIVLSASSGNIMKPHMVGSVAFQPSTCIGEMAHVELQIDGKPMLLVLDTGSSNTHAAASSCSSCAVSPKFVGKVGKQNFSIAFGTGGVILAKTSAALSFGGLRLASGSFGAIVEQNTAHGFNFFPPPDDESCYNSFAGLMGLAYQGQDAGPAPEGGTTNGTTLPLLDQLVAEGMPNAFSIETCGGSYPLPCDARRTDNTTWKPSSKCGQQRVGSLVLGGYSSSRLADSMQFTPITDDIHYDVQLLGMRVCGSQGCQPVNFIDSVAGRTEDDCVCSSPDCKAGTISYCSFTVIDSGTDAVYMNSAKNAKKLLETMDKIGMIEFPSARLEERLGFWFNGTAFAGAKVNPQALLEFEFTGQAGRSLKTTMSLGALFRPTPLGLTQVGIAGNLELLENFQHSKFPTLLGGSFFFGKTIFFDRSRRQIGIASVKEDRCHLPVEPNDIDVIGKDSKPTPGSGCRRGTGSGGGCNRGLSWSSQIKEAKQQRSLGAQAKAERIISI